MPMIWLENIYYRHSVIIITTWQQLNPKQHAGVCQVKTKTLFRKEKKINMLCIKYVFGNMNGACGQLCGDV